MKLADLLKARFEWRIKMLGRTSAHWPRPLFRSSTSLKGGGVSLREVAPLLDWSGVNRCHQEIWNWKETLAETQSDPSMAAPSRVAVDEKQIEVDGEKKWLYAAIDTESKLLLEFDISSRRGTDPAAAFLDRLTEKHDIAETEFLVDAGGYLTTLSRHGLSGHLDYYDRNHIEKCFQTVTMRTDRSHSFWLGSPSSAKRWLRRFRYSYNRHRPNQALDGHTPAGEVLN